MKKDIKERRKRRDSDANMNRYYIRESGKKCVNFLKSF